MNRTSPKATHPASREKNLKRDSPRPADPRLAKRVLPRWLLLALLAAGAFGATFALATWSRHSASTTGGGPARSAACKRSRASRFVRA